MVTLTETETKNKKRKKEKLNYSCQNDESYYTNHMYWWKLMKWNDSTFMSMVFWWFLIRETNYVNINKSRWTYVWNPYELGEMWRYAKKMMRSAYLCPKMNPSAEWNLNKMRWAIRNTCHMCQLICGFNWKHTSRDRNRQQQSSRYLSGVIAATTSKISTSLLDHLHKIGDSFA